MRLPIRGRLALVSGSLVAVLLIALGAFVYFRLESELLDAVDAGLRSRADVLLERPADRALPESGLGEPDEAIAQVLDRDGRVVASSAFLREAPLVSPDVVVSLQGPFFLETEITFDEGPVPVRVLAVPAASGSVVVVGASLEDQREALTRLLALLGVGGPVAIALASGVGWLVAGGALRPVERLRSEAEAISGSEPGRRLPIPATGDELARLGTSLNGMLDRLEEAVERERRFVADASHELRTPLANLRAEVELALRRARTSEELEAALRSAAEETHRLSRLAEDLLVLARADGGRLPVRRDEVDLDVLVRETVETFEGRAAGRGLALEVRSDGDQPASVDRTRIRQAVGNLVDNAIRHSPSGGRVTVHVDRGNGRVSIRVTDAGEGFPPSFLPTAFEAFSRAAAGRGRAEGGTGLGLAIVRAVADAHGGTVRAGNLPDGGAIVELELPLTSGSPSSHRPSATVSTSRSEEER